MDNDTNCPWKLEWYRGADAPSSGGSLPSVRHLTHHPYTELFTVYTHSRRNARKIIPQDIDPTVDYIPQDDV